jgi:hypothetical protein
MRVNMRVAHAPPCARALLTCQACPAALACHVVILVAQLVTMAQG